ncbi:MAG: cobalt-precorrin-5B (C(1))-methyltransferase CbiD [Oscillospiraceae bacterium]|nr:cobalt-precorrin-5B (C(1))-methyltransferase CbiD [Oscillospiraceae bacterium]
MCVKSAEKRKDFVLEQYIYRGTKRLRCGYTTGSCAAAAAKAAAEMLLGKISCGHVSLNTPAGIPLLLDLTDISRTEESVSCAVQKDSGDDPDITNGIFVYAEVSKADSGIAIEGGEGVGRITKPGLDQPVGNAAINSTPRRMIGDALHEIAQKYDYSGGFRVIISVPGGDVLAQKTFNPRMGITGGISIIGTTGIVEPWSNAAMVETIRTEANMRRAAGSEHLLLTVGNYSDSFLKHFRPELAERAVMCSNFIGDALDIGVTLGFQSILLIGHIGKLVKLGSGIMNTHSSCADGRMETLIACAALAGISREILMQLPDCVTTDAALDILYQHQNVQDMLRILTERIGFYISARVKDQVQTGAVIFSNQHDILLKTTCADAIISAMTEEAI